MVAFPGPVYPDQIPSILSELSKIKWRTASASDQSLIHALLFSFSSVNSLVENFFHQGLIKLQFLFTGRSDGVVVSIDQNLIAVGFYHRIEGFDKPPSGAIEDRFAAAMDRPLLWSAPPAFPGTDELVGADAFSAQRHYDVAVTILRRPERQMGVALFQALEVGR